MKKTILAIVVTLFSCSITFSQTLNSGRSADAKPSTPVSEVKALQPVQDTIKETDSDSDEPELLKSVESTADVLHYDDVIITGSLAVGFDAVNGESFGFSTIKLKENNLRILFDDTSNSGSFPDNDWMLKANDSEENGANYFAIRDATAGRDVFKIEADASENSLYVDDYGRVGFGTSKPSNRLHISFGDTPGVRLDQPNTYGWGTYTWDIAGNEANFFIRDVTNGNKLPFRIQPGTPSSTLSLKSDGKVGIGTWNPAKTLEIETTAKEAAIRLDRTDGGTWDIVSDTCFSIRNSGDLNTFQIENNAPSNSLFINADGFIGIGNSNPQAELHVAGSIKVDSVMTYNPLDISKIAEVEGTMVMDAASHKMMYYNGTEWISLIDLENQEISLANNILSISGSTKNVSLASFLDNTDDQKLTLSNSTLSIEGGNSVSLSRFENTDQQALLHTGNVLSISGSDTSVDLSEYLDNTDAQEISLSENLLSISGSETSADLSQYLDNTDAQEISLANNLLSISGSNTSVDLSGLLDNTDEQILALDGYTLSISGGNSVNLSSLLEEQQSEISELNAQVEDLTQELADLKELVAVVAETVGAEVVAKACSLNQNVPNPFSRSTTISYKISEFINNAYLAFYSQTGRLIEKVRIDERGEGSYTFNIKGSSQVYLYTLYVDGVKVETKKMIYSE